MTSGRVVWQVKERFVMRRPSDRGCLKVSGVTNPELPTTPNQDRRQTIQRSSWFQRSTPILVTAITRPSGSENSPPSLRRIDSIFQ